MILMVFYGSLRDGGGAVERLGLRGRIVRLGLCRVPGVLYDLGSYPGLIEADGTVVGELVRLRDAATLGVLDGFEGYSPRRPRSSIYIRKRVALLDRPGVTAWVYVYNRSIRGRKVVAGGDWTAYLTAGTRPSGATPRRAPWPRSARR